MAMSFSIFILCGGVIGALILAAGLGVYLQDHENKGLAFALGAAGALLMCGTVAAFLLIVMRM